ncbi:MAG: hypothetical protein O2904_02720 [bacterium]|nr:hypothetical protein [bacterium]
MSLLNTILSKIFIQVAYAASSVWDNYSIPMGASPGNPDFIARLAGNVGSLFLQFISGGAVLAIMWGATGMINSGGNEEGREKAKKIVIFAVGGLILAIISSGLINFVDTLATDVTSAN